MVIEKKLSAAKPNNSIPREINIIFFLEALSTRSAPTMDPTSDSAESSTNTRDAVDFELTPPIWKIIRACARAQNGHQQIFDKFEA